jgi:hypothetical protein
MANVVVQASRLHVARAWPHHKHLQPGRLHHKQGARPRIAVGYFEAIAVV